MIGIVVVSHSRKFAEGVVELMKMMAPKVPMATAGGMSDGSIGTDYEKVYGAIESLYSEDGVVVFADLGSSVMTAEMAIEDLKAMGYENIRLSEISLGEVITRAAIEIQNGRPESITEAGSDIGREAERSDGKNEVIRLTVEIHDPMGIHARPAAKIGEIASRTGTDITLSVNGKKASAKSVLSILGLGITANTLVEFTVVGIGASEAVEALSQLFE